MPQARLYQGLSQRLVLTPQLRQRIDMLAMTKLELLDIINVELRENPVLEETQEPGSTIDDGLLNTEKDSDQTPTLASQSANSEPSEEVEATPKDSFEETDFDDYFQEYLDPTPRPERQRPEPSGEEPSLLEKLTPSRASLYDELMGQLNLAMLHDQDVAQAAELIIGCINSDGYVDASLEEIAALGGWSQETVERALQVVQAFDPPGIGARDLRECLLLQLKARGWEGRLAAKLVSEHLEDLQRQRLPELTKKLEVTLEELLDAVELIRQLDPRPGRNLGSANTQYIVPEVSIVKVDDEYVVVFNDDGMPHLRVSPYYRQMLRSNNVSKEARDFVREKFRLAVELLKNIEHRKRAIYRICDAIVRRQKDYLDYGVELLKPMLLKDIAAELGLSLSTVSRVVNNKYIETPQGVIELRRFFTEGMRKESGEEVSTRVIKLRIQKLIESEDQGNPLTDDDLVQILGREGIRISRRTVTKYRKQLGLLSSRDRHSLMMGRSV
jgi:RNA polymerase sigma-54 factor